MSTKDQLLMSLKAGKGSWVSGEFLGRNLTISRSAIWKHIRTLKDEGYIIESSRKKGYFLRQMTDSLLPNEIREGLKTNVFGKRDIVYFRDTDSTNIRAEHLAAEGAPEGTVVIAEKQTQGKGRRGRYWFSPSGEGIYASVVLRPRISPHEAPKLTLMASVAVAETILSLTPLRVNIKWPNDILVNGKKLAGILTEISAEMDRIHYVVIGIGVNVNMPCESFPSDIRNLATSILLETGEVSQRITLLRTYLEWLEMYYEMFSVGGFHPIMNRWKQLSDMPGKQIRVDLIDHTHEGVVQDIDEDGFLILKDHEGNLRKIISGDITLC
ncbi:MAG: biotin--[acetyl-CoA-carboxylase] ligase [Deltaproteobacteria bacterium]|nr:biotin--[acetyl-CoA-carboxylase] ligase [Deltaproteobacteria bacterium]